MLGAKLAASMGANQRESFSKKTSSAGEKFDPPAPEWKRTF
jgi:hypothetical protein